VKLKAAAIVVVFLGMLGEASFAHHVVARDGNDTGGSLDVGNAKVRGRQPHKMFVSTRKGWTARKIFDRGYFLVYLDTFGNERFDYYILIRAERKRLKGSLWRDLRVKSDKFVSRTKVRKPRRRTVRTGLPFNEMKTRARRWSYRWLVRTLYTGPGACRNVCIDRVPNNRAVVEPFAP
jgi:hypothetical protein